MTKIQNSRVAAMADRTEFSVINLMRFFAAAWVLIFHAQIHFGEINSLGIISPIIGQGVLAMSLFFILSGYILSYRYRDFSQPGAAITFYIARIARLYPVYIFMGLVTVWTLNDRMSDFPLAGEGGFGAAAWTGLVILMFLTATQAWFPSLFPIWNFGGSWSLSVEAFFYSLFPILRRQMSNLSNSALGWIIVGVPLIAAALTAGLMANLTHGGETAIVFYSVPIYRLPEFVFGIAAFVLFIERRQSKALLFIGGATSALIGLLLIYFVGNLPGNIEYGGFFFLGFLSLFLAATKAGQPPHHLARLFNWLGNISYCVYIVQFGTVPLFKSYLEGASTEYQWAFFIGANLALAVVTYYLIERVMHKPVLSLLSGIVLRKCKNIQVLP